MFIGRKDELATMERLYSSDKFEFLVLYGQRRIGKTTLINQFAKDKSVIFFTAKETNDSMNLRAFTKIVMAHFKQSFPESFAFESWEEAFMWLAEISEDQKTVLIIDEYPYAATANKALNSILQIIIDHHFLQSKIKLILSGSHVSFMEKEVLGYKSPLYGRKTSQIQLKPFDYSDAAQMVPGYSDEDKIRFYSVLGGVPYYLSLVDHTRSFEENLKELFFTSDGRLYQESDFLMREEFDQPAKYNAIIQAVAQGANRPSMISNITKIETSALPYYLTTLVEIGFLKKRIPFGEDPLRSRKGIYEIADNTFRFYYEYVYPNETAIERGFGDIVAEDTVLPVLNQFIGQTVFETVCEQYLVRAIRARKLDLLPTEIGRWWGNDAQAKQQADIDIVLGNKEQVLLAECKWRNEFDEIKEIKKLLDKRRLLPNYSAYQYYFFAKKDYGEKTKQFAVQYPELTLVTLVDLFNG